jgi:hypothetical protein
VSWEEEEEPLDDWDEPEAAPGRFDSEPPEDYPSYRLRQAVVKAVALVLIIGVLLALPLGYILDAQIREQHNEAVIAIVELAVMVVLVVVVRASRRRL